MKILVTGAAGFIGSLVIEKLYKSNFRFIATDRDLQPSNLSHLLDSIHYEMLDLSDSDQIRQFINIHCPSHILHLAGIMGGVAEQNPPIALQVNLMGTAVLVDAGLQCGLERFVMATTIGIYDPTTPEPIREDSTKHPVNIYGISKLSSEYLLEWYSRTQNLSVGAVRLPWVFGPGRTRGLTADMSTKLLDSIARGEKVHVLNSQERGDWMYGFDAARAMLEMLDPGDKQKQFAYYFSGAGVYTVKEVMKRAAEICPSAAVTFDEPLSPEATYAATFDDSHTIRDFDWKPEYDLNKAIVHHISTVQNTNYTAEKATSGQL